MKRSSTLLRGFVPLPDGPQYDQRTDSYSEILGKLSPTYASTSLSLRGLRGEHLAGDGSEGAITAIPCTAGSEIITKRPGRPDHRQQVPVTGLMVEVALPSREHLGALRSMLGRAGLAADVEASGGAWLDAMVGEPGNRSRVACLKSSTGYVAGLRLTTNPAPGCQLSVID